MGNAYCGSKKPKKSEYTVSDVNNFHPQVARNNNCHIIHENLKTEVEPRNQNENDSNIALPKFSGRDFGDIYKTPLDKYQNEVNKSKVSELNREISLFFDNIVSISKDYKSMDKDSKFLLKETFFNVFEDEISKIIQSNPEIFKSNISLELTQLKKLTGNSNLIDSYQDQNNMKSTERLRAFIRNYSKDLLSKNLNNNSLSQNRVVSIIRDDELSRINDRSQRIFNSRNRSNLMSENLSRKLSTNEQKSFYINSKAIKLKKRRAGSENDKKILIGEQNKTVISNQEMIEHFDLFRKRELNDLQTDNYWFYVKEFNDIDQSNSEYNSINECDMIDNLKKIDEMNKKKNNNILRVSFLDETMKNRKYDEIFRLNNKINGFEIEKWDPEIHQNLKKYTLDYDFMDKSFQFDEETLNEKGLILIRAKNLDNSKYKIFTDLSIPEGIIGSSVSPGITAITAAMCMLLSFDNKFKTKMIKNLIHPQKMDQPVINKSGIYGIKLTINGTQRLVEIDDLIPKHKASESLGLSQNANNEIWPAIIEKALLKLYNVSNFDIDTNPSMECFHLSSWLPEIINFADIPDKEKLWGRLQQNFTEGNLVLALGTKKVPRIYNAVLDFTVQQNKKYLKLANPSHIANLGAVQYNLNNSNSLNTKNNSNLKNGTDMNSTDVQDLGVYLVEWDDQQLNNIFDTICLSWNPSQYPFRKIINSSWLKGQKNSLLWNESFSQEYNPQFLIRIEPHSDDFEVRIFIERHVSSLEKNAGYKRNLGFKLFSFSSERVFYSHDFLRKLTYSDREMLSDVFIFEASEKVEMYTLVILKSNTDTLYFDNIEEETFFSLYVQSFMEVQVLELPYRIKTQEEKICGEFNEKSCGGPFISPGFLDNEAFILDLSEASEIELKLEGPRDCFIMLYIISKLPEDNFMHDISYERFMSSLNPSFYYQGISCLKSKLDKGQYYIIISIQNIVHGKYTLTASALSYKLTEVTNLIKPNLDNNGKEKKYFSLKKLCERKSIDNMMVNGLTYSKVLNGTWNQHNSYGTHRATIDKYQIFMKNPGYFFHIPENTKDARMKLNLISKTYEKIYIQNKQLDFNSESYDNTNMQEKNIDTEPPSLCICIYKILSDLKFEIFLEDENYAPTAWGFWTKNFPIEYNELGYQILVQNHERGYIGDYELTIHSNISLTNIESSDRLVNYKNCLEFYGEWNQSSAGGNSTEETFVINPQYCVQYSPKNNTINAVEETTLYVELYFETKPYPIGLYCIETDGKDLANCSSSVILNSSFNNAFLIELNTLKLQIKKNKIYTIVPTTLKRGQLGSFILKIYCDETINLDSPIQIDYTVKFNYFCESIASNELHNEKNKLDELKEETPLLISQKDKKNSLIYFQILKNTDIKFEFKFYEENSYLIKVVILKEIPDSLAKTNLQIYTIADRKYLKIDGQYNDFICSKNIYIQCQYLTKSDNTESQNYVILLITEEDSEKYLLKVETKEKLSFLKVKYSE